MSLRPSELWCPICARVLTAENTADVLAGLHEHYLFVHDDVLHPDNFGVDAANRAGPQ
jgi:hypothetical protein